MAIVETTCGKVEGQTRERHEAYLGIPFAAPPVGKLRFAAPEPAQPWAGVRDATAFAASAVQPPTHPVPGFAASGKRDEDCLFLNVYTPRADAGKRPVMVWIHGGGFSYGSGSELLYDGGPLCIRGDVVLVSIHYRLGVLGYAFLGHHGGDAIGASANCGQLDQVAALRWVRDNIAAFGGDPNNVTVFGESAGAAATAALMVMPPAQGLFHRAICQSGTANRLAPPEVAAAITDAWLKKLGIARADDPKLRELPAQALVDALGPGLGFSPMRGVPSLPDRPLDVVARGGTRELSLLLGSNRDEVKLFALGKREPLSDEQLAVRVRCALPRRVNGRGDEMIGVYRDSRRARNLSTDNQDICDAIEGDSRFRVPANRLAAEHGAHQTSSYLYLFTHESPARRGALGACHALEIPFVFGLVHRPGSDRFVGTGPAVDALQADMMDAWIAFARTGDPSHARLPWPRYDAAKKSTMVLGPTRGAEHPPFAEELAIWESVLAK